MRMDDSSAADQIYMQELIKQREPESFKVVFMLMFDINLCNLMII